MTETIFYKKHGPFGKTATGHISHNRREGTYVAVRGGKLKKTDTLKKAKKYMKDKGWTYDPDTTGVTDGIHAIPHRRRAAGP